MVTLKCKKEPHRQWNQEYVTWEEYGDAGWMCKDGIRKAQLEGNLARNERKNNKKGFYKYIGQKRKI